jgi:hypothetical protein
VKLDGKTVWQTTPIQHVSQSVNCDIDVSGAEKLELEIDPLGRLVIKHISGLPTCRFDQMFTFEGHYYLVGPVTYQNNYYHHFLDGFPHANSAPTSVAPTAPEQF